MTHQVKGVVDKCTQRDQKTRNGMGTIHGCIVDGVEFETGFKKEYNEGEMISTAVKWNYGKWNAIAGDGDGLPAATASNPSAGGGGGNVSKGNFSGGRTRGAFPVPPNDGSISIIRQNSLTHATRIVRDMKLEDLFKPATEEEYRNKVLEIALELTEFSSGQDINAVLKAAMETQKEAANG